ncbi:hypothetical protein TBLA_0A09870 [Henningerozyma blattae CBS 6284]|uniref:Uncharacterized protein n=1 Tax=Henningerozyma blattae (strain ATCC 34711 / CBS 6284 / DSM 70876 / NBRC 10599 / NRRL Y-10934 / UCD 77-7) TaxID=1071380 RepID=I2GXB8_HENB6|nr:hypothetical protein TBLA_0A09870 [Tetrapisispora blattae CBS 6284]CCH58770.1 hypothetical protein TBLA_0A09870 [Tetrapisispora blattae CBS 6284]
METVRMNDIISLDLIDMSSDEENPSDDYTNAGNKPPEIREVNDETITTSNLKEDLFNPFDLLPSKNEISDLENVKSSLSNKNEKRNQLQNEELHNGEKIQSFRHISYGNTLETLHLEKDNSLKSDIGSNNDFTLSDINKEKYNELSDTTDRTTVPPIETHRDDLKVNQVTKKNIKDINTTVISSNIRTIDDTTPILPNSDHKETLDNVASNLNETTTASSPVLGSKSNKIFTEYDFQNNELSNTQGKYIINEPQTIIDLDLDDDSQISSSSILNNESKKQQDNTSITFPTSKSNGKRRLDENITEQREKKQMLNETNLISGNHSNYDSIPHEVINLSDDDYEEVNFNDKKLKSESTNNQSLLSDLDQDQTQSIEDLEKEYNKLASEVEEHKKR